MRFRPRDLPCWWTDFRKFMIPASPHGKKLHAMMRAYLQFGVEYPDYYEIMFSRNTPKYADYKGTAMEPAATIEKQTALKVADITCRAINDLNESENSAAGNDDALYRTIIIWCTLHGVANLLNSRVLQEVVEPDDTLTDRLFRDLMQLSLGQASATPH